MAIIQAMDTAGLWIIQDVFKCSFLDTAMPIISALGNGGFIWILFALILMFNRKTRPTAIAMSAAMLLCFVGGNLIIKNLVCRPRPYTLDPSIVMLIKPSMEPYSFPSGHTMNAFSAAAVLLFRREKFSFAAITLAVLIAFSRIYLMMHFPLDVIGGALIGLLSALLCCAILKKYEQEVRYGNKIRHYRH